MPTEPAKSTVKRTPKERTVSPRVDGKRPRLKSPPLNVDEHVRQEEIPMTNPAAGATVETTTEIAPKDA